MVVSKRRRIQKTSYVWTDELTQILEEGYKDGREGRRNAITKVIAITHWPRQACYDRARALKLTQKYPIHHSRRLTQEDKDYLFWWTGVKPLRAIAEGLNCSVRALRYELSQMGIQSGRVTEGHTKTELAKYLAKSPKTIQKWIDEGWLKARYEGRNRDDDPLRVSDEDFRDFYKKHSAELSLLTLPRQGLLWLISVLLDIPNIHEAVRDNSKRTNPLGSSSN